MSTTGEQRGPGAGDARAPAALVQPGVTSAGEVTATAAAEPLVVRRRPTRPPARWSSSHLLFVSLLSLGLGLRVATMIGVRPLILTDASQPYLGTPSTSGLPLLGYSLFELRPLSWIDASLPVAVTVQHVLGLAIAVGLYVLLLRWGVWRWLSALATTPALLDLRVVTAEHQVSPQTLFVGLVTAAMLVVGWRSRPNRAAVCAFGALLGVAATVLPVAVVLLPLAVLVAVLVAGAVDARLVNLVVAFAGFMLPVFAYVGWQHSQTDTYPMAAIAGTSWRPDALSEVGPTVSAWAGGSMEDASNWQLDRYTDQRPSLDPVPYYVHGLRSLSIHAPAGTLARISDSLQTGVPVLLTALLLGLAGALGLGRTAPAPMRAVCGALTAVPLAVVGLSIAAGTTSWGDTLAGLVLWPAAGALGLTAVVRGRRGRSAARPQSDEVDRRAAAAFDDTYSRTSLGPVVVVIAAYNEAAGLPAVLERIPDEVCALATDVVIVDDGSSDATYDVARADPRAYVVACPVNRGQGAALRLGYRIARAHGARYILTTDADGQYDTADFPRVLAPVIAGDADFVTGSRTLGHQHTYDRVRRVGVHVFAWIVSAFVGQRVTDTSFGLRAMRAEATETVTLNQPQYQSSELLLGMFSHGFRVAEVPGTMHQRSAGSTKKGRNLVYGFRYARVVFGTWWREGCPAPVTESAPALVGRNERAARRS